MAYIKKPPQFISRSIELEESVSDLLNDYARFVECTPDHVANSALKKSLWRDREYRRWRAERRNTAQTEPSRVNAKTYDPADS
jgi:hypothetical protein